MKLKKRPADGYQLDRCAACNKSSTVIDGTQRIWDEDIPLCDDCCAKRPDPERRPRPVEVPVAVVEAVKDDPEEIDIAPEPVVHYKPRKLFG